MTTGPFTLVIDIGGTGLKASVLDSAGAMITDRVRILTAYPAPPDALIAQLGELVQPLPPFDRISVGFPGVVRANRIISAPKFVTKSGPGSAIGERYVKAWDGLDFGAALEKSLGRPVRVVNDADLQGLKVFTGSGLEVVITLGTGMGFSFSEDGRLGPHVELGQHLFRKGKKYDETVGDAARKKVGNSKWNKRVRRVIEALHTLVYFDLLYIGGGNAKRLTGDLGSNVTLIDPNSGILGGIKLWEEPALRTEQADRRV
jgi:polyphosphate glucokinase